MTADAAECLRRGDLDAAFASLQASVRHSPTDAQSRAVLAQLLMVTGQWERAGKQLGVLAGVAPSFLPLAQVYGAAVGCERVRADVFAGRKSPLILGEPPEWIGAFIQALAAEADPATAASAATLRESGRERADATGGSADGRPFEWLSDADPRLGPVFEMLVDGRYYWVPVERVRRLRFDPPKTLRDLVWSQVSVTWVNGGDARALMPVRYPGSESNTDPAIRLARATSWEVAAGSGDSRGVGQRIFATSSDEFALLEVREIVFEGVSGAIPQPA